MATQMHGQPNYEVVGHMVSYTKKLFLTLYYTPPHSLKFFSLIRHVDATYYALIVFCVGGSKELTVLYFSYSTVLE